MGHPLDEPVIITEEELASLQADYPLPGPRLSRRNKGLDQEPAYLFPYVDYRPKQLVLSRHNKPQPPNRSRGYVVAVVVLLALMVGFASGVALDRHAHWLARLVAQARVAPH